jgi:hypothetical protein
VRKGQMRVVAAGKRTTAATNSAQGDLFVPGWDKTPGMSQHSDSVAKRAAQGEKKTPFGRTTLKG